MDRQNAVHLLLELGHYPSSWKVREAILDDRPNPQPDWGRHRDDVLARLNAALNDPDDDVRVAAAVALDDINDTPDGIVELLQTGLSSRDIIIQTLAALHLGRLGAAAAEALPALEAFVSSNVDPNTGTHFPVLAARKAIDLIRSK